MSEQEVEVLLDVHSDTEHYFAYTPDWTVAFGLGRCSALCRAMSSRRMQNVCLDVRSVS